MSTETMTIEEAKASGYTHWVYPDDGWQGLKRIEDIEPQDFERGDIELVNKEPDTAKCSIQAAEIIEWVADKVDEEFSDETGCDTNAIGNAISEIDPALLDSFLNAVYVAVGKLEYYTSTGIRLTN